MTAPFLKKDIEFCSLTIQTSKRRFQLLPVSHDQNQPVVSGMQTEVV